jgi:hypothetical protein
MCDRTDPHRPTALVPEDYDHILTFARIPSSAYPFVGIVTPDMVAAVEAEYHEAEAHSVYMAEGVGIHGAAFACDACGARYNYGSLFRHKPTGEVISMGHDCADNFNMGYPVAQAQSIRKGRERALIISRKRSARFRGLLGWARKQSPELLAALKADHYITKDIRQKLIQYAESPRLSPKQEALLLKLAADTAKREERKKEQDAEPKVPVPVTDERIRVEGTVVSFKWDDFGGGKVTVKVETPDGSYLLWGTCPSAIVDQLEEEQNTYPFQTEEGVPIHRPTTKSLICGRTLSFTAKVKPGNRDPHFGFFSRPTKPQLTAK